MQSMKWVAYGAILCVAVGVRAPAFAHIIYSDLGTLSAVGDSASRTSTMTVRGWLLGANENLGDSHRVGAARGFYKFSLAAPLTVRIAAAASSLLGNPAFSVYAGVLPPLSHDDTARDPLVNTTFYNNGAMLYGASPTDRRPDDPLISRYIPLGYDAQGEPLVDPATGFTQLIENPAWSVPDPVLSGLSPAEWYAANYTAHNGYRDTLNFTLQGGLRLDPTYGWVPNNFTPSGPYNGFEGQFDAFGDWSMANDLPAQPSEWSEISYISSVSATPCAGPNCLFTTTGRFLNVGHVQGSTGPFESLLLNLPAGQYTIVADGEGCGIAGCPTSTLGLTLTVSVVPVPAAAWLFGSGIVGLVGLVRRTMTSRV